MAAVLAFLGYAIFVYGIDFNYPWFAAAGCLILGLSIGALWAEVRLTTLHEDSTMSRQKSVHHAEEAPTPQ